MDYNICRIANGQKLRMTLHQICRYILNFQFASCVRFIARCGNEGKGGGGAAFKLGLDIASVQLAKKPVLCDVGTSLIMLNKAFGLNF